MGHKATLVSLDGLSKEMMVGSPLGHDIIVAHCRPPVVAIDSHTPHEIGMNIKTRRYRFYRTEPVHIYREVYESHD